MCIRDREYYIPKLCIQLVVENAIVHGLEPKLGKGNVEVDIRKEDEHICICVNDNGIGFDMDGEVDVYKRQDSHITFTYM